MSSLRLIIEGDGLTINEDVSYKDNLLDYINYLRNKYFSNEDAKIYIEVYNNIYSFRVMFHESSSSSSSIVNSVAAGNNESISV